jgi:hypothetical protein
MNLLNDVIGHIETHDVEKIRRCFESGLSPNEMFNGKPLIEELTSEYARSPRFKQCVRVFVEHGLHFQDKALLAVLLDNSSSLQPLLDREPTILTKKYSMRCAYTPLFEVTLLHICAEFNHVACAELLIKYGANIDARAGIDEHGFGGQTPIFHTVNQNSNQSAEMMDLLLDNKSDLKISVTGLIWGKGYPWETFIPAVNPISYAMMGVLPQMHRNEVVISKVVSKLMHYAYGVDYKPQNVPCAYLKG